MSELDVTLTAARVPPRYTGCRLAAYTPQTAAQRAALRFVTSIAEAGTPSGGALIGPVGIGKTHLAVGVIAARADRWLARYPEALTFDNERNVAYARPPFSDRFVGVPHLLDELRTWQGSHDGQDPLWRYVRADLLVLDDLGRERATDFAAERLYLLVDERYAAALPTLVTSNYSLADLRERGYDALLSRVSDGGSRLVLDGTDHRLERA